MDWFLGRRGKTGTIGKTVNTGKTANNGTRINLNIPEYKIPNNTLDEFSVYMTRNLTHNMYRKNKKYNIKSTSGKSLDKLYNDLIINIDNLDNFIQKFFNYRLKIQFQDKDNLYKFDILFIYFLKKNKDKMAILLQDTRVAEFIKLYTPCFDLDFNKILKNTRQKIKNNENKQKDANAAKAQQNEKKQKDANAAKAQQKKYMNILLNDNNTPVNRIPPNQPSSQPASQQPINRNVLKTSYNTNMQQIRHFLHGQIEFLEKQYNTAISNQEKKNVDEYVKKYTEILACIAEKN